MLSAVQSAPDDAVCPSPVTSQAVLDLRRRNIYSARGSHSRKVEHQTLKMAGEGGYGARSDTKRIGNAWYSTSQRKNMQLSSRICQDSDYDYSNPSPATSTSEYFGSGKSFEYFYSDGVQQSRPASRRAFSSCRSLRTTDMDEMGKRFAEPRVPQIGRRNSMRPQMFLGRLNLDDVDYDENTAPSHLHSVGKQETAPMSKMGRMERFVGADDIQLMPTGSEFSDKCPLDMATGNNLLESFKVERFVKYNNPYSEDEDILKEAMDQKCPINHLYSETFSIPSEDGFFVHQGVAKGINQESNLPYNNKKSLKSNRHYKMSRQFSETIAADKIGSAWIRYKKAIARHFEELVFSIDLARQVASLTLQRYWRGYRTRKFVYDEVCRTRIVYWDPSIGNQDEALLECYTIIVRGGFTVPPWTVSIPMKYCSHRKIYIVYLKVSAGTYPCKFIVNGEQKICPCLYPTVLDRDGFENSAVTLAEHPQKSWWMARFPRREQLDTRQSRNKKANVIAYG